MMLGVLRILRGVKFKYNLKSGMSMSHPLISGVVIKITSLMVATSGLLTKIRFWETTQPQRQMAEGPVEGVGVLLVKRATVMMGRKECEGGKLQNLGAAETISFASCWSSWGVNLFYY